MSNHIKRFGNTIPPEMISTDEEYDQSTLFTSGLDPGVTKKKDSNKLLRQLSAVPYLMSEYLRIKSGSPIFDDETIASFMVKFDKLLQGGGTGGGGPLAITQKIELPEPICNRTHKPWNEPKPGYLELNGQKIAGGTKQCKAITRYLTQNTYELITWEEYDLLFLSHGSIGAVHKYAVYPDGSMRIPDTRGDYIEACGFDDRASLEWRTDAMRQITGSFRGYRYSNHTSFSSAEGVMFVSESTGLVGAERSTTTAAQYTTVNLDSNKQVPSASVIRPRAAGYMHVIYVGVTLQFAITDGRIYMSGTESKHIGEIYQTQSKVAPPGAVHLDGSLLKRTTYPALFLSARDNNLLISEEEWQATVDKEVTCKYYSEGDGATTFRLPIYDPNAQNWFPVSILCVHAFHAVVVEEALDYDSFVEDVAAKVFAMVNVQAEIQNEATFVLKKD